MNFADRLNQRIDQIGSRLVIGIDPDPERVFAKDSPFVQAFSSNEPSVVLDGFCDLLLQAAEATACAVKPQSAFFEAVGLSGLKSLARCIRKGRSMGIPVILDAKRGDIGNTAKAYAQAFLSPKSEMFADALTVNPYLGPDTLMPFVEACKNSGSGLFVLVKTSNPGSGAFQDSLLETGEPLFSKVGSEVAKLGQELLGDSGYSSLGAVVGATYPEHLRMLRKAMPNTIFLLPGYGAQGGKADDVKDAFQAGGKGAIVSSSRAINFAYKATVGETATPEAIGAAMLAAAKKAQKDVQGVLDA